MSSDKFGGGKDDPFGLYYNTGRSSRARTSCEAPNERAHSPSKATSEEATSEEATSKVIPYQLRSIDALCEHSLELKLVVPFMLTYRPRDMETEFEKIREQASRLAVTSGSDYFYLDRSSSFTFISGIEHSKNVISGFTTVVSSRYYDCGSRPIYHKTNVVSHLSHSKLTASLVLANFYRCLKSGKKPDYKFIDKWCLRR